MKSTLTLVAAALLAACVETAAPARQSASPTPEAVRDAMSADLRNPRQAREFLYGNAELRSLPAGGLALLLDGGSRPGLADGFVDQVFVLQQEAPAQGVLHRVHGAEMFYTGSSLLVRVRGRPEIVLSVDGADGAESWRASVPAGADPSHRWSGYGLSRRAGAWTLPLDGASDESVLAILPACGTRAGSGQVGTAAFCDSGGEGSTGCSTSCGGGGNCSTSCASGFYSCCSAGECSCKCVRSQPVEPTSTPAARQD